MMKNIALILATLIALPLQPLPARAAISELDRSQVEKFRNLLANPGAEGGKAAWTTDDGANFTTTTTAANVGEGRAAFSWDASASSKYVMSAQYTVPPGLYEQQCLGRAKFKGFDTGVTFYVVDGSGNTLGSTTLSATTNFQPVSVRFKCPSSGTVAFKLVSTANAAVGYWDVAHLGGDFLMTAGTPTTAWASFTPTGTITTNATYTGRWRRVGDQAEYDVTISFSGANTQNVDATVNLVSGQVIDTTKLSSANGTYTGFGRVSVRDEGTDTFEGSVLYSTTTAVSFVVDLTSGTYSGQRLIHPSTNLPQIFANTDAIHAHWTVPIVGWTTGNDIYNFEASAWQVDANISGANPSLGTSAVTSYQGIENSGLTLTNNTMGGGITAQIPCSSTNPPTGTTCAVGNESLGVSFTPPGGWSGDAEVCFYFSDHTDIGSGAGFGDIQAVYKIVQTPSNAQTISTSGKTKLPVRHVKQVNGVDIHQTPVSICDKLTLSGGQNTLRLFYVQAATGGAFNSHVVLADASGSSDGGRDVHVTVRPITQNYVMPVINDTNKVYVEASWSETVTNNTSFYITSLSASRESHSGPISTSTRSRFTAPKTAMYHFDHFATWASSATFNAMGYKVNGGTEVRVLGVHGHTDTVNNWNSSWSVYMTAGDYIEFYVQESSGSNQSMSGKIQVFSQ